MSDIEDDDKLALDLDGEFEWDDALGELEKELAEEGVAGAKSPSVPAPKQPAVSPKAPEVSGEYSPSAPSSELPLPSSNSGPSSLFDDLMKDFGLTGSKPPAEDLLTFDDVTPVGIDLDALLDGLEAPEDDTPAPVAPKPRAPRPPPPRAKKPGYAPPPPPPVPSALGAKRLGKSPPLPMPPTAQAPEAPALEAPALEAPALEAPALEAPALEAPALEEPFLEARDANEGDRPSPLGRVRLKKGLARHHGFSEVDARPIEPTPAEKADENTPALDVPNFSGPETEANTGVNMPDDDDDFPDVATGDANLDEFGNLDDFDFDDEFDEDFGDHGFGDDEDEDEDAHEQSARSRSVVPAGDAGAQTAARTVRNRKPRVEVFPLVGRSPDAMRARVALLQTLATKATGSPRARLLVAAAELSEQLGEGDVATGLYGDAHEADPRDVVALRALRRDAVQRGEWSAVGALLVEETKLPLSAEARSAALTLLAEVQLTRFDDAASAQKSARAALGLRRDSVAAALLLAETGIALGRDAEALTALERAAEHWQDGGPRGALYSLVALSAERAGRSDKALESFSKASEADPSALDATLGLARVQRAKEELDETVVAIARASEHAGEGAVAEAYRRAAARVVHLLVKLPEHAAALLHNSKGVLGHRARADAARDAGQPDARKQALEAWAAAAGGSERALALTVLAEVEADVGNFDAADQALRDAALADDTLTTIGVIREILSRRAGGSSRLSQADPSGSALTAAAKLARGGGSEEQETALIARAVDESDSPTTAAVLSLDISAAAGDAAGILSGLGRQVERASGEDKVGPLLTLAIEAHQRGDLGATESLLEQAREARPGNPIVLRALARHVQVGAPIDAAECWLEEAGSATGTRAAFAATNAGRLLADSGQEAGDAFGRALAATPGYGPAAWAQERLVRAQGDATALSALNLSLAEAAVDAPERASRFVRAALLLAASDPKAAATILDKARDAAPGDSILVDLALRLSTDSGPARVAALLTAGAESTAPEVRRGMLIRAAAAHFDGGEPAEAAAIYRRVLEDRDGDDPVAERALDEAEIAAGEISRVASRRFDAVKEADGDDAQVEALAALADLDLYDRGDRASAMLSLQSILEVSPGHVPSLRALERYFMDQSRLDELAPIEAALVKHLPDPRDAQGHARLYARLVLGAKDAPADAADEVLLDALGRGQAGLWTGRRGLAAALLRDDPSAITAARTAIATHMSAPLERAEGATRSATALRATDALEEAVAVLAPAVAAAPEHLAAAMALAGLYRDTGDHEGTARTFEIAGRAARAPELRAELFHAAGVVLEDDLKMPEQAAVVYAEAAQANITHSDLFDRYRRLLANAGDNEGLATLTERRIAAGGDVTVLAELQSRVADLREQLGDQAGAKEALRAALSFEGENADALKRLAELSLADEDYRGAAEALIRLARVRKDSEELHWVFFTLGKIYDDNMPDSRRAEAA
ncbi:MAG: hypothetical protein JRH11_02520, partial [Deltaproteobacteria bacterium]|nr:hypothetical protein [Deltaproteobacteria bacterium]